MNLVDSSIPFQVEVTEENPGTASSISPEEGPNHLEQMWAVLYSRPGDVVTGIQADTAQDALKRALGTIEHDLRPVRRNRKEHWKLRGFPNWRADDLMDMGVLVGEVYDQRILKECSH
jgi:hypothetical protein